MVQLERRRVLYWWTRLMFQFHKSSIRTDYNDWQEYFYNPFQFHNGSIRTRLSGGIETADRGFNSIMVQLEHRMSIRPMKAAAMFQFHKGSIRTVPIIIYPMICEQVSIPLWFN